MRVTIYARKSTSHEKAAEEAKSVTRQIDLARAFVNRQDGWIVSEDHVFVDDAVSGGIVDRRKRPGLDGLLYAAKSVPARAPSSVTPSILSMTSPTRACGSFPTRRAARKDDPDHEGAPPHESPLQ